jgi:hypothetical protein
MLEKKMNLNPWSTSKPRLLILGGLLSLALLSSGCSTLPRLRETARVDLGPVYGASSINVSVFRQSAVLSAPQGRLVGFYDGDGEVRLTLVIRDGIAADRVLISPRLEDRLLGNGHCVISLGLSPDRRVHVLYGAHETRPWYASFPLDLLDTEEGETIRISAAEWPQALTYPQFYLSDGRLHLLYRRGRDFFLGSYENGEWDLPETPLVTGEAGGSVYPDRMAVKGKNVALPLAFRMKAESPNDIINDGIYIALSSDGGRSWHDRDGEALPLPLKKGLLKKLVEVPPGAGLMNQNSSVYGPEGRIYITSQRQDREGIPQIFLSVFDPNDGYLCTTAISKNNEPFSLKGMGTLRLPLSRPDIAVSEKGVYVIYRQGESLVIAQQSRKEPCSDRPWNYYRPDVPPLGVWEPNYDQAAWTEEGSLILYIQNARQGASDHAIKGDSEKGYLYEFRESFRPWIF